MTDHSPEDESVEPGERRGEGSGRAGGPPVLSSELERVIRRATELQQGPDGDPGGGGGGDEPLSEAEIVRIGREVGLEPRHVRRALAEVRAESLLPEPPEDDGLPHRLWGDAFARASRAVPGDPEEVRERVERHFRERESLQAIRSRPGRSLWEPAGGLVSKMQRALDVGGRGYELAEARRVELTVTGLESGWSLVTVTADLRNVRAEHATGWTAGAAALGFPALVVATAAVGLPLELAAPLVAGGAGGASALGARRTTGKRRRRVELVLEGLLDRLESGESLGPDRSDWRDRLLG